MDMLSLLIMSALAILVQSDECILATFSLKPSLVLDTPSITGSFTLSPTDCAKLCASTVDCLSAAYNVASQFCSLYQSYQDPDSDVDYQWGYDANVIYLYDIVCQKTKMSLITGPNGQRLSESESLVGCNVFPGIMKFKSVSACSKNQADLQEAISKILSRLNDSLANWNITDAPTVPVRNCSSGSFNFSCFPGLKILGNLIGTYRAASELSCAQRCYHTPLCASANFISGRRCELMTNTVDEVVVKRKPLKTTRTSQSVFISDLCCGADSPDDQTRFTEQLQPLLQWMLSAMPSSMTNNFASLTNLQSLLLPSPNKVPKVPAATVTTTTSSPTVAVSCGQPAIPPRIDGLTLKWTSASPSGPRIVGGTEATPHSWPWQISLRYNGAHICGGSLISADYIVTAAHCSTYTATGYSVALGVHDKQKLTGNYIVAKVVKIVVHPQYNSPKANDNDIAVMKLDRSVAMSDEFSPVCLAASDSADGTNCVVTGWGDTQGQLLVHYH